MMETPIENIIPPTDERVFASTATGDSLSASKDGEQTNVPINERTPAIKPLAPLQPPRALVLYIDGDNQSPAITHDLLMSVRQDWGLEVARVVIAGNDHGQSVRYWQTALTSEGLPAERILVLRAPLKPESADQALILELGANMERHRQVVDLVFIVSRDKWVIGMGEAVRARGCRVWIAYAESEWLPAQTSLPTLLLPAVQRSRVTNTSETSSEKPLLQGAMVAVHPESSRLVANLNETVDQFTPSPELLDQIRAKCKIQYDGSYMATDVGQALCSIGLISKSERARFLKAIPGLKEIDFGPNKRLIF